MLTYCVKCRKNTENVDLNIVKQKITELLCYQNAQFVEFQNRDL